MGVEEFGDAKKALPSGHTTTRTPASRRIAAAAFLVLIVAFGILVLTWALAPDPLPVGGMLPEITLRTTDGARALTANPTGSTVVVYFHSECSYCHEQFEWFEKSVEILAGSTLVLVTSETEIPEGTGLDPKTAADLGATMGSVAGREFRAKFGTTVTPAIYVFDARRRLRAKFFGATSMERLQEVLLEPP